MVISNPLPATGPHRAGRKIGAWRSLFIEESKRRQQGIKAQYSYTLQANAVIVFHYHIITTCPALADHQIITLLSAVFH
jgi:hypothetical protein